MIKTTVLGINSKCALSEMPYEERYKIFKDVGFSSVLLWGGEEETPFAKRAELARKFGLIIENAHASYVGNTYIWNDDLKGNEYLERQKAFIDECKLLGITTVVLHPEGNEGAPKINEKGLQRYMRLFDEAEKANVRIAIENIHLALPVEELLKLEGYKNVGFCFDSGHANIWERNKDFLSLFGNRLFALHLHDNDGVFDLHSPLFTGTVEWDIIAKKLSETSYDGTLTLETKFKGSSKKELIKTLESAYESGKRFARMLDEEQDRRK